MPGNDDPWACDEVLDAAARVHSSDDRMVQVGEHEMISCAYANRTPWNSPRELDEDALYDRIKRLASQLERPDDAIFNLHVPPYDSGLDTAREINEDLKIVYASGQPHEIPVGSKAVRQLIEEYQPMLSLHGHIHESGARLASAGRSRSTRAPSTTAARSTASSSSSAPTPCGRTSSCSDEPIEIVRVGSGRPELWLIAGVHGDEVEGMLVVEEALRSIRPGRGTLVGVPVAHPPRSPRARGPVSTAPT